MGKIVSGVFGGAGVSELERDFLKTGREELSAESTQRPSGAVRVFWKFSGSAFRTEYFSFFLKKVLDKCRTDDYNGAIKNFPGS